MPQKKQTFDGVAAAYRALEFLAFGGDLERTRFAHLGLLADCREVLVLGDGDGRFAFQLASLFPRIRIHSIDQSAAMIEIARRRMHALDDPSRISFSLADATTVILDPSRYDAVTTIFFLDCFTDPQVAELVRTVSTSLKPEAKWLFADFSIAPKGYARLRSRLWVGMLYGFFRWTTGITARRLPSSEAAIEKAGFARLALAEFQAGLLRSAVYARTADSRRITAAADPGRESGR